MTCRAQRTAADWGQDRRRSDLTLHGAVMAMRFLVARDNPSTPEISTSDHTRSRAWVVAATTRRPNHQTIWSHAAWAPGIVPHERKYDTSTAPSGPDRRLCWLVIAGQTAQPPDQRRASGLGTSGARPSAWGPRLHAFAATARPTALSSVRPTTRTGCPKPLQGGQQEVTHIPPPP